MRRPRLPRRLRLEGIPASRTVCGLPLPAGLQRKRAVARRRFSRPPPRKNRGTTSTSPFEEMVEPCRSRDRPKNFAIADAAPLSIGGADYATAKGIIIADTKFEWGRGDRTAKLYPHRRSADARQLALLACRRLPARDQPAFVRQAVRPRLAGNHRLGQEQPAAAVARRHRPQDARQSTSKHTKN